MARLEAAGAIVLGKTNTPEFGHRGLTDNYLFGPGRNPFFKAGPTTTSADNYLNPKAYQVTYGFERQVANGLVVDYQLNHVNTVHLERNVDYNFPRPFVKPGDLSLRPFYGLRSGTPRPNPNIAVLTVRESSARANFT